MQTSIVDEHITSRAHIRNMNSTTISNGAAGAAPPALMLSPMSLRKRLPRSGKKLSLAKSSLPAVARVRFQKPDRPSPVQDHERRGFGGLLSLLTVHAGRRDGEDLRGGAMIWNGVKPYVVAAARVDVCLTI